MKHNLLDIHLTLLHQDDVGMALNTCQEIYACSEQGHEFCWCETEGRRGLEGQV